MKGRRRGSPTGIGTPPAAYFRLRSKGGERVALPGRVTNTVPLTRTAKARGGQQISLDLAALVTRDIPLAGRRVRVIVGTARDELRPLLQQVLGVLDVIRVVNAPALIGDGANGPRRGEAHGLPARPERLPSRRGHTATGVRLSRAVPRESRERQRSCDDRADEQGASFAKVHVGTLRHRSARVLERSCGDLRRRPSRFGAIPAFVPASRYVDLERDAIDPSAVSILPVEVWRRLRAIGVSRDGDVLIVAMADPDDERAVRELELRTGLRLFVARATEETIHAAIDRSHEDG